MEDSASVNEKLKGRNSFLDVELFLIAEGRLPNNSDDKLTREMVKKVIDFGMLYGDEKAQKVLNYAFHLFHILGPNHSSECKDCKE